MIYQGKDRETELITLGHKYDILYRGCLRGVVRIEPSPCLNHLRLQSGNPAF